MVEQSLLSLKQVWTEIGIQLYHCVHFHILLATFVSATSLLLSINVQHGYVSQRILLLCFIGQYIVKVSTFSLDLHDSFVTEKEMSNVQQSRWCSQVCIYLRINHSVPQCISCYQHLEVSQQKGLETFHLYPLRVTQLEMFFLRRCHILV